MRRIILIVRKDDEDEMNKSNDKRKENRDR